MTTFLKWLNSPLPLGILIGAGVLVDLVLLGRANDLSKSDWSGWVQAIGSIAALAASFGLFYAQKRAELNRTEAQLVLAQTKGVIAVSCLSRRAIIAMETATEQMECQHALGVIPFSPEYLDELRVLFSQFINPACDFMALQHALAFSDILMEAKHDFSAAFDEALNAYVVERSHERLDYARSLASHLDAHQHELLEACRKHRVNPVAGPLMPRPAADHETA